MTRPARTVFLGSGEFAVPIAESLARQPLVRLVGAVTALGRPAGRRRTSEGSAIGRWAGTAGIPILTPARLREPEAVADVSRLRPDLIVLADYGQIVPRRLLELPRHGALNLHPSLLPRHRGASPIPAAILAGDDETGVSLMLMDAGLDTGPLIAQRRIPLGGRETAAELEERLAHLAAELLAKELDPWLAGELTPRPQASEGQTLTRPLRRDDGRLDPRRTATELERQVRAYQPWPGSYVDVPGTRLIIWAARPVPDPPAEPGTLTGTLVGLPLGTTRPARLALRAADELLELLEVQPAGGRRMTAMDLLRGRPQLVGAAVTVAPGASSGE